MHHLSAIHLPAVLVLVVGGALAAPADEKPAPNEAARAASAEARQLDWEELVPESERERLSSAPPPPMHNYLMGEYGPAAPQSMSFEVNKALDGIKARIPGFIVPLEADGKGKVIEFFLVPYFGACIHVPPPPPNQIVYVKLPSGIALDSMYEAYWITGTFSVRYRSTRFGAAAYSLAGEKAEVYKY